MCCVGYPTCLCGQEGCGGGVTVSDIHCTYHVLVHVCLCEGLVSVVTNVCYTKVCVSPRVCYACDDRKCDVM